LKPLAGKHKSVLLDQRYFRLDAETFEAFTAILEAMTKR